MEMIDNTDETTGLLYDRKGGRLYYKHESGLTFTATMREIADANDEEAPHAVHLVIGAPMSATAYTPEEDSPEGRAVIEWAECLDSAAEAIGRIAVSAMSAHKQAKKLRKLEAKKAA